MEAFYGKSIFHGSLCSVRKRFPRHCAGCEKEVQNQSAFLHEKKETSNLMSFRDFRQLKRTGKRKHRLRVAKRQRLEIIITT